MVFASSSILANPVSRSSGSETSMATTLVSTLYLAANYQVLMLYLCKKEGRTNFISDLLSCAFPPSNQNDIETLLGKLLRELSSDTSSSSSDHGP